MTVAATAEVLVRYLDTGFEADLKKKVGTAVDKVAATTKGIAVPLDDKSIDGDMARFGAKYDRFLGRLTAAQDKWRARKITLPDVDADSASRSASKIESISRAVSALPGGAALSSLSGGLNTLAASSLGASSALAVLGPVALVAVAAIAAFKGVTDFARLAEEVDSVQDVLGGTAEEASKVRFIAVSLGLSVEQVAQAMFKFSSTLDVNKDKLAGYGVAIAKTKDGTTDTFATLVNLSNAFNGLADPVEKNRLLLLAFGRGGRELEEILSRGGDGLRELADEAERAGVVLDQAGVQKGKDFNIAMRQLGETVKGVLLPIGEGLIPLLITLADVGKTAFGWIPDAVGKLQDLAREAEKDIPILTPLAEIFGTGHSKEEFIGAIEAKNKGHKAEQAAIEAKTRALEDLEVANTKAAAFAGLPAALSAVDKARAASADKLVNTRKAEESLAEAQERVADLQVGFAEQAAAAKEAYAEKVVQANERVADSEGRLVEAIRTTGERIASAEATLARARIDSAEAVAAAQKAANEANIDAHQSLRDAERELSGERARQNAGGNAALLRQLAGAASINSATAAVARAREKEGETRLKGIDSIRKAEADGLETVQNAERSLIDARTDGARTVAEAEKSVVAARAEQNKVAAEGLEVGRQTTAQTRQMRDATEAVTKAQGDLTAARIEDGKVNTANLLAEAEAQTALAVKRAEARGEAVSAIERNRIYIGQLNDLAKTAGEGSPLGSAMLATSLIIRGIAKDMDDATAKTALFAAELKRLTSPDTIDFDTGSATSTQGRKLIEALLYGGGRMAGGPIKPGYTYTVGESGVERLDMFRGGGGFVTPLSNTPQATPAPSSTANGPLIGQLVVQGATVAAAYATGVETARAVRAAEYARTGR